MGLVMAGTSLGLMVGPSVGGWLYESGGMQLPFLTVATLALVAAAGFLWLRLPTTHVETESVPLRLVVGDPTVMSCVFVVVVASSTIAMLEPVLSLWLALEIGLTPARVGLLFGIAAVATTGLHPLYGRLADRWGGRLMTLVGLALTAAMLPILSRAWSFQSAAGLYVLQAAAIALVITPSLTYMADVVSRTRGGSFGVAYGLYNFAWGVGLLTGPAIGGFLYERIGFSRLTLAWTPLVIAMTILLAGARVRSGDATRSTTAT